MTSDARKMLEDPTAHLLSVLPFRPRILGARMEVLTLGHISLLMSLNCAYATSEKVQLADTLVCWEVCRRSLADARAFVGLFVRPADGLISRLKRAWQLRQWEKLGRKLGFRKLEDVSQPLIRYVNEYFTLPPQWDSKGGKPAKYREVPWPEYVATVLSSETVLSREEAYQLPVNDAMVRYLYLNHLHGDKSLMAPADYEAFLKAEAMAEAKKQAGRDVVEVLS